MNECSSSPPPCVEGAVCANTFGSYRCLCGKGERVRGGGGRRKEDVEKMEDKEDCYKKSYCNDGEWMGDV